MEELIAITQKALQSQSWKMKAQGASAMATLAKQSGSLVPPHLGMVLRALLQGLSGRTWTGKVKLPLLSSGLYGKGASVVQKWQKLLIYPRVRWIPVEVFCFQTTISAVDRNSCLWFDEIRKAVWFGEGGYREKAG